MEQSNPSRANYGLDAPGLVRFFLIFGLALTVIGVALVAWRKNAVLISIGFTLFFPGLVFFIEGWLMIFSSKVGKLKARDGLLDNLHLAGNETVLDVGCGRGLLLIGADSPGAGALRDKAVSRVETSGGTALDVDAALQLFSTPAPRAKAGGVERPRRARLAADAGVAGLVQGQQADVVGVRVAQHLVHGPARQR